METLMYDDPKQVLEILNSLGIINITAKELKIFLKELKLFKKITEKKFNDCKLKKDITDNTYIKNLQNTQKAKLINTISIQEQNHELIQNKLSYKQVLYTLPVLNQRKNSIKSLISTEKYKINREAIKNLSNVSNIDSNHKENKIFISKSSSTLRKKTKKVFTKNDPVTLYNQYKLFWEKLSIPGEKNRKLLGSNSVLKI